MVNNKTLVILAIVLGCALAQETVLNRIHDFNTEDLKKLALAGQMYDREQLGRVNLLEGLEKYINSLNPKQIKDIIQDYIYKHPELNQPSVFYELAGVEDPKGRVFDLEAAISKGSRKLLERLAIECESYENKKKGTGGLYGGLITYIWRMKEDSIQNYIRECVSRSPELKDNDLLVYLADKKRLSLEQIKEILNVFDRVALTTMAIAADEYDRELGSTPRLGGLIDYIGRLDNEEIKEAILSFARRYPELREEDYLRGVIARHSNLIEEKTTKVLRYLSAVSRKNLNRIALSMEKYSRIAKKVNLLGGLHDYIDRLSDAQVIKIIQEYIQEHRELNDIKTLRHIVDFTQEDVTMSLVNLPLEELKNVCLALEQYDRDQKNLFLLGGLHDYIDTLKLDDLMRYIIDLMDEHPILSLPGAIQEIAKTYADRVHRH